jgi:hypothetical protein
MLVSYSFQSPLGPHLCNSVNSLTGELMGIDVAGYLSESIQLWPKVCTPAKDTPISGISFQALDVAS